MDKELKCIVCDNIFKSNYFDKEQSKCILHCKKTSENNWYTALDSGFHSWNKVKINLFWRYIQNSFDDLYEQTLYDSDLIDWKYTFKDVVFPKFQPDVEYFSPASNEHELGTNFYSYGAFNLQGQEEPPHVNSIFNNLEINFIDCIFLHNANFERYQFKQPLVFRRCNFHKEVSLSKHNKNSIDFSKCDFHDNSLKFTNSIFEGGFRIQDSQNIRRLSFYNSTFNDIFVLRRANISDKTIFTRAEFKNIANFQNTVFNNVTFVNTLFENITTFSEAVFYKDVQFKNTIFSQLVNLSDTIMHGSLNLKDTVFNGEANFLDMSPEKHTAEPIKVKNRETARTIKKSFESKSNIIEANKYYALEMQAREKELSFFKNPSEWLIFKIHGLSSNHSQDWFLALLWIAIFTYINCFFSISPFYQTNKILFTSIAILPLITVTAILIKPVYQKIFLSIFIIFSYYFAPIHLNTITSSFYSVIGSKDNITFYSLIFNLIIVYLVYQSVISIRQDTRRK